MVKVFISYSRLDKVIADEIASELRHGGAEVFVDYERLQPGENFPERLALEIEDCGVVVFLHSQNASNSKWVRDEIQYANHHNKRIIRLDLDSTNLPRALFFLTNIEAISFQGWTNLQGKREALTKLLKAVNLNLKPNAFDTFTPMKITLDNAHQVRKYAEIEMKSIVKSIALSPDGDILAVCLEFKRKRGLIKLLDFPNLSEIGELSTDEKSPRTVAFSPDGRSLAAGLYDGTVKLWSTSDYRHIRNYPVSDHVFSVAFSYDSKLLGCACISKNITINPTENTIRVDTNLGQGAGQLARFTSDGRFWIVSMLNAISVLDLQTRNEWSRFEIEDEHEGIQHMSLAPDSRLLAISTNFGNIYIWDLVSAKNEIIFSDGEDTWFYSTVFLRESPALFASTMQGIQLWSLNGTKVATLDNSPSNLVILSPNEMFLISTVADTIKVFAGG